MEQCLANPHTKPHNRGTKDPSGLHSSCLSSLISYHFPHPHSSLTELFLILQRCKTFRSLHDLQPAVQLKSVRNPPSPARWDAPTESCTHWLHFLCYNSKSFVYLPPPLRCKLEDSLLHYSPILAPRTTYAQQTFSECIQNEHINSN